MAEPRKVPFVTLSAFAAGQPSEQRKRRREDDTDINVGDAGLGTAATGAAGCGMFAKAGDGDTAEPRRITVRLDLCLSEPSDQASAEFNYSELLQSVQVELDPCVAQACSGGPEGGDGSEMASAALSKPSRGD